MLFLICHDLGYQTLFKIRKLSILKFNMNTVKHVKYIYKGRPIRYTYNNKVHVLHCDFCLVLKTGNRVAKFT
jgi:hypothetical protein